MTAHALETGPVTTRTVHPAPKPGDAVEEALTEASRLAADILADPDRSKSLDAEASALIPLIGAAREHYRKLDAWGFFALVVAGLVGFVLGGLFL